MAVSADGLLEGTIGGGVMEHKFVELAKSRLREPIHEPVLIRQVHDKSAGVQHSGMICSGEQDIFLYEVTDADLPHIQALNDSNNSHLQGALTLSNQAVIFSNEIPEADVVFQADRASGTFKCIQRTGPRQVLHIIGGGHCSIALSKIMRDLDFYIHVYDDRPGLNTMDANEWAHEKHIVVDYASIGNILQGGDRDYVVIMTFGYRSDDVALKSLYGKSFQYIGMLGSKNKIQKIRTDYENAGMDPYWLEEVHAPIGIQIKSKTTAEIAVSIAAEIISVKNRA